MSCAATASSSWCATPPTASSFSVKGDRGARRPPAGPRSLDEVGILRAWIGKMSASAFRPLKKAAPLGSKLAALFGDIAQHGAPDLVQTSEVRNAETKTADDFKLILREFARDPFAVATVCPSSPFLARHLANSLNLADAKVVVELGPGTGALTEAVLPRLSPGTRFLAVERNPVLCAAWKRRYPQFHIIEGNVADLQQICADQGIEDVDCVVSGLPWPSFDFDLQQQGLSGVQKVLGPGGQMATFGYHIGLLMPGSQRYFKLLAEYFSQVERLPWEWRNLPPAFITRCTK